MPTHMPWSATSKSYTYTTPARHRLQLLSPRLLFTPPMPALRALPVLTELSLAYTSLTDGAFPDFFFCTPLRHVCPAPKRLDPDGLALGRWGVSEAFCARRSDHTVPDASKGTDMHGAGGCCGSNHARATRTNFSPSTADDHARADQGVDG
ncbi:hypothetical protein FIBSPDRAFT_943301 [Athelia psychrophila]|uniref:Uncharacterized protein n=1 Tax=Athelia psychrophila TaxID=1759441 RepID=A0A166W8X3_9AGAM|nr:hypothetical protein FIBSPDRAFT_943301 [Fibularhizoctonia sp. CBS 109695]